ncbi:MAG TPA: UTP--glucose-1-phosphate uridylyltransferase [Chloroflexi bacterium]|nr:UTP--glucose-1-phosphate uridylyltransferase [Chloroflexota bacterium]
MKVTKAVITAAGKGQRNLPLQTLIDRDGTEKSVLSIIVEEVLRANVEEICIVIRPGDESAYAEVAGDHAGRLLFVQQPVPLGYGHGIYCARDFIGGTPFLHLVGDHLYVSRTDEGCAQHLTRIAEREACAVSAVQETRENLLPYYGAIGGQRIAGRPDLYQINTVIEKPTPTEAEQRLIMPGLRAGHYLCFFGMHVLTPTVIDILGELVEKAGEKGGVWLGNALAILAGREQYLGLKKSDWRYDIGVRYGLLIAQLALALSGQDRDQVLTRLLELLALRELGTVSNQG